MNNEEHHLTRKEILDGYLALMQYHGTRQEQRRSVEWKITLGLWAVLVGTVGISKDIPIPPLGFAVVAALVWATYAFVWLPGLWRGSEIEKKRARHHRDLADDILANPEHELTKLAEPSVNRRDAYLKYDYSIWAQAVSTLILTSAIIIWLCSRG